MAFPNNMEKPMQNHTFTHRGATRIIKPAAWQTHPFSSFCTAVWARRTTLPPCCRVCKPIIVSSHRTHAATGVPPSATRRLPPRARQPRRRKLITVGASWQPESLNDTRELYAAIEPAFLRENMGAQVAAYEAMNPEANLDRLSEALKALWLDDGTSGYPGASVSKIRAPVLAIRGEGDFLLSMQELLALHTPLPNAHLMNVPFTEHEAIADQPDLIWAALQAFRVCT